MPDRPCWYFCRTCGYRGQFVAEEKESIKCPKCAQRYATSIMRRQGVEWSKLPAREWK